MEILWELTIGKENSLWSMHECNFYIDNNDIYYAFSEIDKENINHDGKHGEKIIVYKINILTGDYSFKETSTFYIENICLPNQWKFYNNGIIVLDVGKYLNLSNDIIEILPDDYMENKPNKEIIYEYEFENKIIKYNGKMLIECIDKNNNKISWKIPLVAYLYTRIEYKNGCIIFGTAGKGSSLYCVELLSGIIKSCYKNVKAVHYEWYNNTIFASDKKGNLQQIDIFSDKQKEAIKIKSGKMTDYSPIKINEDKIYTIIFDNENVPKIICIKI